MNKVILATVMACALLFLDVPEATAHEKRDSQYRVMPYQAHSRDSYRRDYRRDHQYDYRRGYYGPRYKRTRDMPRWMQRNRLFRHWVRHSGMRENRGLSWNQLFDIYRWEHHNYRYDRH